MLPAPDPGSIINRCSLGAEGSSLLGSTGDGLAVTGGSEEPVVVLELVDGDGVSALPEPDAGGVVESVVPEFVVVSGFVAVWATAGVVAISDATAIM